MNLRILFQLFSFRDLRNSLLGLLMVCAGLGFAGITIWINQNGNPRLAGIAAVASLAFVLLIRN